MSHHPAKISATMNRAEDRLSRAAFSFRYAFSPSSISGTSSFSTSAGVSTQA